MHHLRGDHFVVVFPTDLGWMAAGWNGSRLSRLTYGHPSPHSAQAALAPDDGEARRPDPCQIKIIQRLQEYAGGKRDNFADVLLDPHGLTEFQRRVVLHCRRIPYGTTWTYAQLAARAGSPRAARAVGNVMAANRVPLIVPCHRVISANGSLGGYSTPGGIGRKRLLLLREGALRLGRNLALPENDLPSRALTRRSRNQRGFD